MNLTDVQCNGWLGAQQLVAQKAFTLSIEYGVPKVLPLVNFNRIAAIWRSLHQH